jgi:hypothetical protein
MDNGFVQGIQVRVRFPPCANSGMVNALLCAETVALMILGRELPKYFPRSYLATQERFQSALYDAARAERGRAIKKVKL